MKILYLANIRLPTEKAHGVQIMKTCEALAASGAEVVLYIPQRKNSITTDPFDYYQVKKNFTITTLPSIDFTGWGPAHVTFILSQISFALRARKIASEKSDIVYARDEVSLYVLSFFKRRLYFEAHDARDNFLVRRLIRVCDGIICVAQGLADLYVSRRMPSHKVRLIPNGADLAAFDLKVTKEEARKKFGLPQDGKIVLYTGHLYGWKGVNTLAAAAELLSKNTKVAFVGGTEHDLNFFKEKHTDTKNLLILGHKPHRDIPLFLAAADVVVMPNSAKSSLSELYTSPVKMFEYLAAGKPIIASDLPSIRGVLNDSNAILVKPDDPAAIAAGISSVLDDASLAKRLGDQARKDSQEYSWMKRAERIMSFVQEGSAFDPTQRGNDFYDDESHKYSIKRYPARSIDYTHSFYLGRLALTKKLLKSIVNDRKGLSVLEVGCADGVVIRSLKEEFGTTFSSYKAVDISPGMIKAATQNPLNAGIEFSVRDPQQCYGGGPYDAIVEIGVLNYTDLGKELSCAASAVDSGGYYLVSIAGKDSWWDKMRRSETGFAHFDSYREYEKALRERFDIVQAVPVGLFIPAIWRAPSFARAAQVVAENVLKHVAPDVFHEMVYLLKKKNS